MTLLSIHSLCQHHNSQNALYHRYIRISRHDLGNIESVLKQWPHRDSVKGIVVTDGQRILGLGDLGAFGMGIPIGKIALYTAIGGIKPSELLPIMLDVGTNNERLLNDPFYFGVKEKRDTFTKYDELLDEFMIAVESVFGTNTLVQFEDFGNGNAFRLLTKYQDSYCTFNDDIQGTAAVTMAGIYASLKGKNGLNRLQEHKFLIIGAGSAGIGIANIISTAIMKESDGQMTRENARKFVSLVDSRGLIFNGRTSGGISDLKAPYAHDRADKHDGSNVKDIKHIVQEIGATAIIGVSGQPKQFTKEVVEALEKNAEYPLIFSLSNPTSMSECTAQEAYDWTQNKLYFASGSPFELREDTFADGRKIVPSQGNNAYIFPGVALGIIASEARRVPDDIFLIASETVAGMVSEQGNGDVNLLDYGVIYPVIDMIRGASIEIAVAVAEEIHRRGLTDQKKPSDLRQKVLSIRYDHDSYDQGRKIMMKSKL